MVDAIISACNQGCRPALPLLYIIGSIYYKTFPLHFSFSYSSFPYLGDYHTLDENKQYLYLIIHITFIWYSVTMGNFVVE